MDTVRFSFMVLLCLTCFPHSLSIISCVESEMQALLKFKQDLQDSSNMLAEWSSSKRNCCSWIGVVCSNVTGHVTELHLGWSLKNKTSKLGGKLNRSLLDLKYLSYLDLSENAFEQTRISSWFWNLVSSLQHLNISGNQFQGSIPDLLTTSHSRVVLDFSSNNFTGPLPRISLNVTALDLSNNAMSGSIDNFLCNGSHELMKLEVLNLSNNRFSGNISDCWKKWPSLVAVKLCDNKFSGKIPNSLGTLASLQSLHLQNNSLAGELPSSLGKCTELLTIDIGANQLFGEILPWIERLSKLIIISLQANRLTGPIPEEICALPSLQVLDLSHNNLSGKIPSCALPSLQSLHLRNNSLAGELPSSLGNCTELLTIDIGVNQLSGDILPWIERLTKLIIISLQANRLTGPIPEEICALPSLQVLDLSRNNLSGKIPSCISNLTAMISRNKSSTSKIFYNTSGGCYYDNIELVMKGVVVDYSTTLKLIKLLDLSNNNLTGEIPEQMTDLQALISLNLSNNHLVGRIPHNIGAMGLLECVDLSENSLSGGIPTSMTKLNFLSYLNVSNNNLTGTIPTGTQLQSLNESSFLGNNLKGPPLTPPNKSYKPETPSIALDDRVQNGNKVNWLYLTVEFGFFFGFLTVSFYIQKAMTVYICSVSGKYCIEISGYQKHIF